MSLLKFLRRNYLTLTLIGAAFFIAIVLAIVMFRLSVDRIHKVSADRFQIIVDDIISSTKLHYAGSATTLRSLQGFFAGSENVTRKEFYKFIETSDFYDAYPGFSTFAYIPRIFIEEKEAFVARVRSDTSVRASGYPDFIISPDGMREEYWPILYIDPEETAENLLGIDQFAESGRSENIQRARDSGSLSISKAVILAPANKLGVIIAAPLYRGDIVPESLEKRRDLFNGVITSALYLDDFFGAFLPIKNLEGQGISITVGGRGGDILLVTNPEPQNSFFSDFYGLIQAKDDIDLDTVKYEFTFEAPVSSQLSFFELFEPFFYIIIFFFAALFISLIILIFQRAKTLSDLKKRFAFITTLSHQLRTPLTRLKWKIESSDGGNNDNGENKKLFSDEIAMLSTIIQRMLLYVEIEEKENLGYKKTVTVESLYEKALQLVPQTLELNRILRVGDQKIDNTVFVNEEMMALTLCFVIENALIYSPKGERVVVEIKADKKFVEIKISDSGYGIPAAEQGKLFKAFFRASNASLGKNTGSGISLFIARRIIELHGGKLMFTSREGEGSEFRVRLPLKDK